MALNLCVRPRLYKEILTEECSCHLSVLMSDNRVFAIINFAYLRHRECSLRQNYYNLSAVLIWVSGACCQPTYRQYLGLVLECASCFCSVGHILFAIQASFSLRNGRGVNKVYLCAYQNCILLRYIVSVFFQIQITIINLTISSLWGIIYIIVTLPCFHDPKIELDQC